MMECKRNKLLQPAIAQKTKWIDRREDGSHLNPHPRPNCIFRCVDKMRHLSEELEGVKNLHSNPLWIFLTPFMNLSSCLLTFALQLRVQIA